MTETETENGGLRVGRLLDPTPVILANARIQNVTTASG